MDKKKKTKEETYPGLLSQIEGEYKVAYDYLQPKRLVWEKRLKLYSNQKKDARAVGDPLLFTIMQTVIASLYDDKLAVTFEGRELGDEPKGENLTLLADYDYSLMEKDILDYNWAWNAGFYGRALCMMMEFDRKLGAPIPELFDPMVTLRDPIATSVNGDMKGRGAARFLGRPLYMTHEELKGVRGVQGLKELNLGVTDKNSDLYKAREARDVAQNRTTEQKMEEAIGSNKTYPLLQWFTWYEGKRVMVLTGNANSTVVKVINITEDYFPIIDRSLYPLPNDWDGVTIPDLIEDKQRYRAKVLNLASKGIEANLYPKYFFNSEAVPNTSVLNHNLEQYYIPVEGNPRDVVQSMDRQVVKQEVDWIMTALDSSAEKATSTPAIQQGALSTNKRAATELKLVDQGVDARYSLSAKVFGWSERRFWRQWYNLYKKHFTDKIDEKVLRVVGGLGNKYRKLSKEDITSKLDFDIKVESTVVSSAKQAEELQKIGNLKMLTAQDPGVNQKFINKKMAKLSGMTNDEIMLMYPPTPDELIAQEENEQLGNKELTLVKPTDNHMEHLFIHNQAKDSSAKEGHIAAHKEAMKIIKAKPGIVPPESQGVTPEATPMGGDKGSLPKVNYNQPNIA